MDSSSPPRSFFRFGFPRKKSSVSLFFCVVHYFYSRTPRLWYGLTAWLRVVRNLHHKLVLSLRSESQHSDLSLTKPSSNYFSNEPWPQSRPPTMRLHLRANPLPSLGHHSLSDLNLGPIVEEPISAPSQGAAGDIHPPSMYEAQL